MINTKKRLNPKSLEEIADSYPRLYTKRRFSEWRALFHYNAVAGRTGPDGQTWVKSIDEIVKDSKRFSKLSEKWFERWENVVTDTYGNIAVIQAEYYFETDIDIRKGKDCLLVIRGAEGWQIVALVYDERFKQNILS